jgi:hypothetical protein
MTGMWQNFQNFTGFSQYYGTSSHFLLWLTYRFLLKVLTIGASGSSVFKPWGLNPEVRNIFTVFGVSLALVSEDRSWFCLRNVHFLSAFAEFRKATISLVISVFPSICMEKRGSNWKDFYEFWYWNILRKSFDKIQVSLKAWITGTSL